jgi:hypothetical protein
MKALTIETFGVGTESQNCPHRSKGASVSISYEIPATVRKGGVTLVKTWEGTFAVGKSNLKLYHTHYNSQNHKERKHQMLLTMWKNKILMYC